MRFTIDEICSMLSEEYNSVLILGSYTENGRTEITSKVCGDWYACAGMAHEFLKRDNAKVIAEELGNTE